MGEISRHTLSKDFRNIDPSKTRIILIEGGERILSAFSTALSETASRHLEKLGVTVWTSIRVTDIEVNGVWMGEEFLKTNTVLWAAGIQASNLNQDLEGKKDRIGRIHVESDLSVSTRRNIFVIGDQAHVSLNTEDSVPPTCPRCHSTRNNCS